MNLTVIRGVDRAREEISRVDPLDTSTLPPEVRERARVLFGEPLSPLESVQRILDDVRRDGDAAVRRYTALLDGAEFDDLAVPQSEIDGAREHLPQELVEALELAARRVEEFHRTSLRKSWVDLPSGLGELVVPLERAGVYAPGGTAAYPSTVLMTAIPAKVAGVKEVVLASPCREGDSPPPAVLFAAGLAGVDRVFRIGGVQAIGAMAFGTESVPKVDKICGPGNIFVTLAKKLVFGYVDIDGLYGPTETVVVADDSASPAFCAADLIAQAEHDPLACPILVTTSLPLIAEVEGELERSLSTLERGDLARESLERQGRVVLVDGIEDAIELANHIAPEHLCLMVRDPWAWAGKVRHAGGLFLGEYSPEVMGDYVAGPSHVMPTGGTARYSSALGVHQFLKTVPVVALRQEAYRELGEAAVSIARAEGLTGHARAAQVRLDYLGGLKDGTGSDCHAGVGCAAPERGAGP